MTIKDQKQAEFTQAFLDYPTRRATIIAATGVGKSKVAMNILDAIHQNYDEILIVVNADRLRDVTWKKEFAIWNKRDLLDTKVDLRNYQTVYKWDPVEVPLERTLIIADEIDFAIGTPEYGKFFYNYRHVDTLGLTGYCAEVKYDELNKLLPVIVNYSWEQAVADGVINDVKFHFLKFDLDKDPKGIRVEYKKDGEMKHFYQSENQAYDYADVKLRIAQGAYEDGLFDNSLGLISDKELEKLERIRDRARDARIKLLYNSVASAKYAIKLQQAILDKSNANKVIVFSKFTEQANKINKYTYHSKNKPQVNEKIFDAFNSGRIRSMSVCSKIDRGDNIVGLNNIILESYNSSDTIIRQRVGRGARLEVHEVTNFYIMLPYFMRKVKDEEGNVSYRQAPTQMVKWCENMLSGYNLENIKIYDYRSIKSDL